jgi:hypothetical protein
VNWNGYSQNGAKLVKADVEAKRNELPDYYLSQIKIAYLDEGPIPSHHAYGWVST